MKEMLTLKRIIKTAFCSFKSFYKLKRKFQKEEEKRRKENNKHRKKNKELK